jgi:hypothetical protein
MPRMRDEDSTARIARIGRRAGILAFAVVVGGATAIWSLQILRVVFGSEPGGAEASCRGGLVALSRALERARLAAAGEGGGERAALLRFRAALDPEWHAKGALERTCEADPKGRAALKEIDALRYAEEHAVRYEAEAIAALRRRAEQHLRELSASHTQ